MRNRTAARVVRLALTGALAAGVIPGAAVAGDRHVPAAYIEIAQQSMAEKFGLQFHVGGQIIPGVVTRIADDGTIEARSQAHDRIIIRLDRVDAIVR